MRRRRLLQTAAALAGAASLAAVFLMYTRPDFVVGLADRVWSCF